MPKKPTEVEQDMRLKIQEPRNTLDDKIYKEIINTLSKLPNDVYERCVEIDFVLMGSYGRYLIHPAGENEHYSIEINCFALKDNKPEEIQAVIAHEIAHHILDHNKINYTKLPIQLEDEADELAIKWGFDGNFLEKTKKIFTTVHHQPCDKCKKEFDFDETYYNRLEEIRICFNCAEKIIKSGIEPEKIFLNQDLMKFDYWKKKKYSK
ncbi:MAG: hypothetical protein IMZ52_05150 [Actinobacteria bacterium]|nr:hypothetical protein [Actinomycetota bacterium]MBE3121141.1 hypothetical protein [Thermoplasmata archaeon]